MAPVKSELCAMEVSGRSMSAAVVQHIIQALLDHIRQILCQYLGGLRLIDRRNSLASLRNSRKLAGQGVVDDLFIQTGMQHNKTSFHRKSGIAYLVFIARTVDKGLRLLKIRTGLQTIRSDTANIGYIIHRFQVQNKVIGISIISPYRKRTVGLIIAP